MGRISLLGLTYGVVKGLCGVVKGLCQKLTLIDPFMKQYWITMLR